VDLVGSETVDGRQAWHLRVTTAKGSVRDYYLDPETALEFRVQNAREGDAARPAVTYEMSDYRDVQGVKMPFHLKQSVGNSVVGELTISSVEINPAIDDSLFRLGVKK
jgi:hypothetical protein